MLAKYRHRLGVGVRALSDRKLPSRRRSSRTAYRKVITKIIISVLFVSAGSDTKLCVFLTSEAALVGSLTIPYRFTWGKILLLTTS